MAEQDPSAPVTVLRSSDPAVLAVAESLLDAAGIEFFLAGEALTRLYPGVMASAWSPPEIRVAPEHAEDARELLKELG